MIKKLRVKFICNNMLIVTLMLLLSLSTLSDYMQKSMISERYAVLHSIAEEPDMNAATNLTSPTAMLPSMPATTAILPRLRCDVCWCSAARACNSSMEGPVYMDAFSSGGFAGQGLGQGTMTQGGSVPQQHTDFIFSVAGEELGFVKCSLLIALLFAVSIECIRTSVRARDLCGQLICIGIAAIIGFQGFVNICVVTGIFPNTGLTLPFISYGLTSLVTLYAGMGFVLNVSMQAKKVYL